MSEQAPKKGVEPRFPPGLITPIVLVIIKTGDFLDWCEGLKTLPKRIENFWQSINDQIDDGLEGRRWG